MSQSLTLAKVEVEYVVGSSDDDIYFMACNERADRKADAETMSHTTLQRVFSVLNCKNRMEKTQGEMSNWAHVLSLFLPHLRHGAVLQDLCRAFSPREP